MKISPRRAFLVLAVAATAAAMLPSEGWADELRVWGRGSDADTVAYLQKGLANGWTSGKHASNVFVDEREPRNTYRALENRYGLDQGYADGRGWYTQPSKYLVAEEVWPSPTRLNELMVMSGQEKPPRGIGGLEPQLGDMDPSLALPVELNSDIRGLEYIGRRSPGQISSAGWPVVASAANVWLSTAELASMMGFDNNLGIVTFVGHSHGLARDHVAKNLSGELEGDSRQEELIEAKTVARTVSTDNRQELLIDAMVNPRMLRGDSRQEVLMTAWGSWPFPEYQPESDSDVHIEVLFGRVPDWQGHSGRDDKMQWASAEPYRAWDPKR